MKLLVLIVYNFTEKLGKASVLVDRINLSIFINFKIYFIISPPKRAVVKEPVLCIIRTFYDLRFYLNIYFVKLKEINSMYILKVKGKGKGIHIQTRRGP